MGFNIENIRKVLAKDFVLPKGGLVVAGKTRDSVILGPYIKTKLDWQTFNTRLLSSSIVTNINYWFRKSGQDDFDKYLKIIGNKNKLRGKSIEIFDDKTIKIHYILSLPTK